MKDLHNDYCPECGHTIQESTGYTLEHGVRYHDDCAPDDGETLMDAITENRVYIVTRGVRHDTFDGIYASQRAAIDHIHAELRRIREIYGSYDALDNEDNIYQFELRPVEHSI